MFTLQSVIYDSPAYQNFIIFSFKMTRSQKAPCNSKNKNIRGVKNDFKRKHKSCNMKTKLEILKRIDNGEAAVKLAKEFNVGKSTISDWKRQRSEIDKFVRSTMSMKIIENRCTLKKSRFSQVDEATYLWFLQERERGTPLSGPIIREKARQLHEKFQEKNLEFVASEGWFSRWRQRHGLRHL